MDLRAQHLSETCSDPIEFLNQLRQTTEPIGGGTVYSKDGELVEYDVAIEAVEKANKAFIEKAGDEWKKQQMMKEAVSATIDSSFCIRSLRKELMAEIWHKSENHPDNRHPYPVINPDTKEMAFAYYDKILSRWVFDRNYNPGRNMLWMDVEKILPKED